jgi:hemolysin III
MFGRDHSPVDETDFERHITRMTDHLTIVEKAERIYSHLEHRADATVHILGILFAINASLWLLWHVTGLSVAISVFVYCAGLLAMIIASAAYNLAPHGPSKSILRRLDHAAIFIMIAATYTPFAMNRLGAPYGTIILAAIWLSASFGVAMKILFPRRFEVLSIGLYLAMGWLIVTVIQPLHASMTATDFWLLVAGGLVYSAGVAFYLIERIPYHKAIWHGFVLIAAVLHFSAIAFEFAG